MLVPKFSAFPTAASLAFVIAALFMAPSAFGATFTVTNTNDTGAGSLRQAVIDSNTAAGSDTIVFSTLFDSPQTIQLASAIFVSPGVGNSLTITGPGMNLLTVRGNGAGSIFSRNVNNVNALLISDMTLTNAGSSAVLNDNANLSLTVTNVAFTSNTSSWGAAIVNAGPLAVTGSTFAGNTTTAANGGGAIYTSTAVGTSVTISNSAFSNNSASGGSGGAIRIDAGAAVITGSTFTSNSARNGGGAISSDVDLTIGSSTFTGNSAGAVGVQGNGGALSNSGSMSISGTTITGNSATRDGGAIYTFFSGDRSITNSTISNNTANTDNDATGDGGGIYSRGDSGPISVSGSTISGNQALGNASAAGNGGGVYTEAPLALTNATVSGNTAGRNGGGIHTAGTATAVVTIESSTVVENTAIGIGGGLARPFSAVVNLHNSIFANNTDNGTAPEIQGTVVSQGYNLIEVTTGATITGDTTGNITGQDPDLGPLADNSGPTFTHAPLAGSPVIEAADPADFPATDQRGVARPQNGDFTGAALPDIGAYEVIGPTAAPVLITGRVFADGRPLRGAIVTLMDPSGGSATSVTNSFGYFRFTDVAAGESYILSVAAKRYRFESQLVNADADVTGIVFEAARPRFDPPGGAAKPAPAGPSTARSAPPVPAIRITRRKSNELEMY